MLLILELGARLHSNTVDRCEREKTMAVRSTEESVWARAEVIKQETIERALKKAKAIHEREIKKLVKSHEKTLKVMETFCSIFFQCSVLTCVSVSESFYYNFNISLA